LREEWADSKGFPKLSQYLKVEFQEDKIYSDLVQEVGYNIAIPNDLQKLDYNEHFTKDTRQLIGEGS